MALTECYYDYEECMTLRLSPELLINLQTTLGKVATSVLTHYQTITHIVQPYAKSPVHINENGYFLNFNFDQSKLYPEHFVSPDHISIVLQDNSIQINKILNVNPEKLDNYLKAWALKALEVSYTVHNIGPLVPKLATLHLAATSNGCASSVVTNSADPSSAEASVHPVTPPSYTPQLATRTNGKAKGKKRVVEFATPLQEVDEIDPLDNANILKLVRAKIPEGYGQLTMIEFPNKFMPPMRYFHVTKLQNSNGKQSDTKINTRGYDPNLEIFLDKSVDPYGKGNAGVKVYGDTIRIAIPGVNGDRPTGTLHTTIPLDDKGNVARLFTIGSISDHKLLKRGAKPKPL